MVYWFNRGFNLKKKDYLCSYGSFEISTFSIYRFAGNKTTLQSVGQKFDVTQSSISRILDRVMNFLRDMGPRIIKMPSTTEEKRLSQAAFKKVKLLILKLITLLQ